jgi:hypothetical protein
VLLQAAVVCWRCFVLLLAHTKPASSPDPRPLHRSSPPRLKDLLEESATWSVDESILAAGAGGSSDFAIATQTSSLGAADLQADLQALLLKEQARRARLPGWLGPAAAAAAAAAAEDGGMHATAALGRLLPPPAQLRARSCRAASPAGCGQASHQKGALPRSWPDRPRPPTLPPGCFRCADLELQVRALCAELTRSHHAQQDIGRSLMPVLSGIESKLLQLHSVTRV